MNRYSFSSNTFIRPNIQSDCLREGQLVKMRQENWNELPWGLLGASVYRSVGKVFQRNSDGDYKIKWEDKIPTPAGPSIITYETYDRLELFHE